MVEPVGPCTDEKVQDADERVHSMDKSVHVVVGGSEEEAPIDHRDEDGKGDVCGANGPG